MVKNVVFLDVNTQNRFFHHDEENYENDENHVVKVHNPDEIREPLDCLTMHARDNGILILKSCYLGRKEHYSFRLLTAEHDFSVFYKKNQINKGIRIQDKANKLIRDSFISETSIDDIAPYNNEPMNLISFAYACIHGDVPVFLNRSESRVFPNPKSNEGGNVNLHYALAEVVKPDVAVVYGANTNLAVQNAASGLLDRGISTYVVSDATGAQDEEIHQRALGELKDLGVKVMRASGVMHRFQKPTAVVDYHAQGIRERILNVALLE